MVCDFAEYVCQTEENVGNLKKKRKEIVWCLSVKLGNYSDDTFCQNIPEWTFDMNPFIFSPLSDVSSLPNLKVVIFLSCKLLLHVLYIENTFLQFVFDILYGGDQTHKRGFF